MMKVLMITDLFPPDMGGRADKMARHVRYFSKFNLQVTVVCPTTLRQSQDIIASDGGGVFRVSPFLNNIFPSLKWQENYGRREKPYFLTRLLPKGYIRWVVPAFFKSMKLIKEEGIERVICVSNPVTMQIIGVLLKLRYPKLRYIAELRDPVIGYYRSRHSEVFNRFILWAIFKFANKVVEWSDFSPYDISSEFPGAKKKYCRIDMVGYDPYDFDVPVAVESKAAVLNIVFTGGYYGEDQEWRIFFNALSGFVATHGYVVEFNYYGHWPDQLQQMVDEAFNHLGGVIKVHGFVSKKECVVKMLEADLLLYLLHDSEENRNRVSSKVYDYIATGIPVISFMPSTSLVKRKLEPLYPEFIVDTDIGDSNELAEKAREILEAVYLQDFKSGLQKDLSPYSCEEPQRKLALLIKE